MWTQLSLPKKGEKPPIFGHVYCGQTAGEIKMELGMYVGLGPDHIMLDEEPVPLPPKGGRVPQFSAHFYCGKRAVNGCGVVVLLWRTAGCIRIPFGREATLC